MSADRKLTVVPGEAPPGHDDVFPQEDPSAPPEEVQSSLYTIEIVGLGQGALNLAKQMYAGGVFVDDPTVAVRRWWADTSRACVKDLSASFPEDEANHFVLGEAVCRGLGTGGRVEMGAKAVSSDVRKITNRSLSQPLPDVRFLIVYAGGGTGTGSALPLIKLWRTIDTERWFAKNHPLPSSEQPETPPLVPIVVFLTMPKKGDGEEKLTLANNMLNDLLQLPGVSVVEFTNNAFHTQYEDLSRRESYKIRDTAVAQTMIRLLRILRGYNEQDADLMDLVTLLSENRRVNIGYGVAQGVGALEKAFIASNMDPFLSVVHKNYNGKKAIPSYPSMKRGLINVWTRVDLTNAEWRRLEIKRDIIFPNARVKESMVPMSDLDRDSKVVEVLSIFASPDVEIATGDVTEQIREAMRSAPQLPMESSSEDGDLSDDDTEDRDGDETEDDPRPFAEDFSPTGYESFPRSGNPSVFSEPKKRRWPWSRS